MEQGKIYDKEGQEIEDARLYLCDDKNGEALFWGDYVSNGLARGVIHNFRKIPSLYKMCVIDDHFVQNEFDFSHTVKIQPNQKRRMTWREALKYLDEVGGKFVLDKTFHQDLNIDIVKLQCKLPPAYKLTRDYGLTIEDFPEVEE